MKWLYVLLIEKIIVYALFYIPEFQHVSSVGNQKRVFGV